MSLGLWETTGVRKPMYRFFKKSLSYIYMVDILYMTKLVGDDL
jgi:hypothetical protein